MNLRLRTEASRGARGGWSRTARTSAWRLCGVAALAAAAGCAGGARPREEAGASDRIAAATHAVLTAECDMLASAAAPGAEPVCGLTEPVDPRHAPVPHNLAERVVFRNLYETLVQVDCSGSLRPGLAATWEPRNDGALWIFTLREGAVFWDGTPVTAAAVAACWSLTEDRPRVAGAPSPWDWLNIRAESVVALDERRLAVALPEPCADLPYLLAHPALTVAARREGWTWPVGSGPCRLAATTPEPLPDLVCRPNIHHPDPPFWRRFTFRVLPAVDPRDLPAHGADLFFVAARTDREHLALLKDFTLAPLPWERLYVLITPPRRDAAPPEGFPAPEWSRGLDTASLARDALDRDARSWDTLLLAPLSTEDCAQLTGPVSAATLAPLAWDPSLLGAGRDVLAYPRHDAAAAQLAGRLAALPAGGRAVGLEPDRFAFALQERQAAGYVVAVDRCLATACLQLAGLVGRAAWLQAAVAGAPQLAAGADRGAAVERSLIDGPPDVAAAERFLRDSGLIRPLVAVRRYVALRGGATGLRIAWDGTPLVAGFGLGTAATELP